MSITKTIIKTRRFLIAFLLILYFVLSVTPVLAEQYSYKNSETLKPLIHWRDYNPDAFKEAQEKNKPIFLLLTAPSWCVACQIYESKDYLFNNKVVSFINNNFIPIYVDADQRQDLTRQYLEGGWPSTVILTPDKQRIYGFYGVRPPDNLLVNLQQAVDYQQKINSSINQKQSYVATTQIVPTSDHLSQIVNDYKSEILNSYDSLYGGFGNGQKFPQARSEEFSLQQYEKTKDAQWLNIVTNTLKNEYTQIDQIGINYKLFDPVEGGFHRYGTTRSWSPPHYEKMLYDNARLLKTYSHLLQIQPDNKITQDVVIKTTSFLNNTFYDSVNGGFYANTDSIPEAEYYGKNPRPTDIKPRLEKTKYTDWNSESIITYLYLYNINKDENIKEIAIKGLDFFSQNMLTDKGAYHYMKETGEKGVQGSLLDNAYMLLTFTKAYETFKDPKYLETAEKISSYMQNNLYDWNGGGFFERNSTDLNLYAPGENVLFTKPYEENGIAAYSFLKLYSFTNDPNFLNISIKTTGALMNNQSYLDSKYYFAETAQIIIDNQFLDKFNQVKSSINESNFQKKENEWIQKIQESTTNSNGFQVSDQGIQAPNAPLIILILVSFLAGLLSFISPCTLPILPAFLAYSFKASKKNIFAMTLSFFAGLSLIFVLLGLSATFIGSFLRTQSGLFTQIIGLLIIIFGIYTLSGKSLPGIKTKTVIPVSYLSTFLFGAGMGISWTPCVGPILVSILLLASTSRTLFEGGFLLFMFSLGLSIPLLIVSFFVNKINRKGRIWRFLRGREFVFIIGNRKFHIHSSSLISGIIFIILGFLIFSGWLYVFNKFTVQSGIQKTMFDIEDKLIKIMQIK